MRGGFVRSQVHEVQIGHRARRAVSGHGPRRLGQFRARDPVRHVGSRGRVLIRADVRRRPSEPVCDSREHRARVDEARPSAWPEVAIVGIPEEASYGPHQVAVVVVMHVGVRRYEPRGLDVHLPLC